MGEAESPSVFSLDYYRAEALKFQRVMDALDQTGQALYSTQYAVSCDAAASQEWYGLMQEWQSKRDQFKLAAEGINAASSGLDYLGIEFPRVTLPAGLGVLPVIPIAAVAAAFAVTAALVAWAGGFFDTVENALSRWQYLSALDELPPEAKAQAVIELQAAEQQVKTAKANATGTMGQIANILKWVAIGGLVFVGYKMIQGERIGN